MVDALTFRSWRRPGATRLATGTDNGRTTASTELTLRTHGVDGAQVGIRQGAPTFLLAGPADAEGLAPEAILHRSPAAGARAAETTMCPYVEFVDPGLPWALTPSGPVAGDEALRPWLVLVVGRTDQIALGDGSARIDAAVLAAHPLVSSGRWCHVQEANGTSHARVLSPVALAEDTDYLAVLVPGWRVVEQADADDLVVDAWPAAPDAPVEVDCLDHWRFRTGPDGDFLSLARRLQPHQLRVEDGTVQVRNDRTGGLEPLEAHGALAPLGRTVQPLPGAMADDLAGLLGPFDDPSGPGPQDAAGPPGGPDGDGDADADADGDMVPVRARDHAGRPIISMPRYGAPWRSDDPLDTTWGADLNLDPRHRGAAGLGAAIARERQDHLAAEAGRQAGALDAVARRIANLALGVQTSGRLLDRRVPGADDPAGRLLLFGPALRRVMTDQGSFDALATAPDRPLPPGWFSTAARRALRRGPARSALAAANAGEDDSRFAAANTCPPPPAPARSGLVPSPFARRDIGKLVTAFEEAIATGKLDLRSVVDRLAKAGLDDRALEAVKKRLASGGALPWRLIIDVLIAQALAGGDGPLGDDEATEQRREDVRTALARLEAWLQGPSDGRAADDRHEAQPDRRDEEPASKDDPATREGPGSKDAPAKDEPPASKDDPAGAGGLRALLDVLRAFEEPPAPEQPPCRPVDLEALAAAATAAFDPRDPASSARRQVFDRIPELDIDAPLTAPEFCPGLDIEVWRLLDEYAGSWLLPGLDAAPDDAVMAVTTNASFTDALLTGLNTTTLEVLRWRNLRISAGCTPVRTFWTRIDEQDAAGGRLDDIIEIGQWGRDTPLGDPAHRPASDTDGGDLVLVVRSELLLRYPATLIFLVPGDDDGPQLPTASAADATDASEAARFPTFRGSLGEDAVFLGFQGVAPDRLGDWWVVFEESPSGYRFRHPAADIEVADDGSPEVVEPLLAALPDAGADVAEALFADPIRVLLRGEQLAPASPDTDEPDVEPAGDAT